MLAGKRAQLEFEPLPVIKALVQKAVHAFCNGALQAFVEFKIDLLQVARFETVKDDLIPDKGTLARLLAGFCASALPLAVKDRYVIKNMKTLVHPALLLPRPP